MRGSDKLSTVSEDSNHSPFRPRPRATTLHVESRWHALRLAVPSTRAASPRVSGNVYAPVPKMGNRILLRICHALRVPHARDCIRGD